MDDLDLNINNYSFDDILNLFKINKEYTQIDLDNANEVVKKLNNNDTKKYYLFFNEAYDILKTVYNTKQTRKNINNNNELLKKNYSSNIEYNNIDDIYFASNNHNFNTKNIYNNQFKINERIITIHTQDRDIKKWSNQNNFEVELPSVMKNVISIELFDVNLPTYYYNISSNSFNTKLYFSIPEYYNNLIELIMDDGYYTTNLFVDNLELKLNETTTKIFYDLKVYVNNTTKYNGFKVVYNENNNKITITNNKNMFFINANKNNTYDEYYTNNKDILPNVGLKYNLGFNNELYESVYDNSNNLHYINAPNMLHISNDNTIYMSIDKYNYIDEIVPYSISTTTYFNNDYNGRVNNAFAKLQYTNNKYIPVNKFKRVLPHIEEKIRKLKFNFHYHNQLLVDFLNQDFDFSIKIIQKYN